MNELTKNVPDKRKREMVCSAKEMVRSAREMVRLTIEMVSSTK